MLFQIEEYVLCYEDLLQYIKKIFMIFVILYWKKEHIYQSNQKMEMDLEGIEKDKIEEWNPKNKKSRRAQVARSNE